MAKAKTEVQAKHVTPKVVRAGVHAKTKTSSSKGSKNYKKPYNGQGK
jgi:hypothetical protein